ncbi:MAG: hypothetical protein J6B48_07055 [Clostridia bacterium]|nr:hypothetical protein [Clostridia bacterium]
MKLKRMLVFCAALLIAICSLFSCKTDVTDKDPSQSGENTNDVIDANCIWGKGIAPGIVLDEYSAENLNVDDLVYDLYCNCEIYPKLLTDKAEAEEHEIVIGDVKRSIAKKAYNQLEAVLNEFGDSGAEGWVIYTNGKSIAIAYNGHFAFTEAIQYFNDNYINRSSLVLDAGILASDAFDTEEYVDEARATRRETELNALVPEIGEEAVAALKNLFNLYTDDLYKWMVDLYDADIGGFYACNSGRNTEGFLPDIQNTAQIINFLSNAGLTVGYKNIREAVPEEIGKQILEYAQSLQSAENGYFYHPQWGKDITTARLGRDLGWATSMIATFGGTPLYDTPNGVKGSLGAPGQNAPTAHLTSKLSVSQVTAVSKIVAASTASLPSYLKSIDAWDTYLRELNIPYNSYHAGNNLDAQSDQIKFAGQEYVDHLINYLDSIQNARTGLWESDDSENDDYFAVNGLMKLCAVYNYFGKIIPNAEAALGSCMTVMLKPDGDTYVCSIYNPWITIYYVLLSAERTEGEAGVARLRNVVLSRAAELIEATTKKIADYRLDDGAFATYGRDAAPVNMLTGSITGCARDPESDVDATCISSSGLVRNIFRVLGCKEVKLYDNVDYVVFKQRWLDLGTIVKKPYLNTVIPATFDEYDPDSAYIDGGVNIYPEENVQNIIGDSESDGTNYKWFSSAVVEDPAPSAEGDLSLRTETFLDSGAEKDKANAMSCTCFDIQGVVRNENCFVFESDLYFERTDGATCLAEIYFTSEAVRGDHTLGLLVTKYTANGKTYLSIAEAYEGMDGKRDSKIASGIPSGEWVRFRFELYKIETDEGLDIKCKVYVNGKYQGTCDSGYVRDGEFVDRRVAAVKYAHYRHSATVTYFDNTSLQAINKEYVEEDDYVNAPTGPQKIDFEDYMTYGDTTYIYTEEPSSPNAGFGVVTVTDADGEETNAYVYNSNTGGKDIFRLQSYGIDLDANLTKANAFTYDADMKLEFNTDEPNGEVRVHIGSTGSTSYHAYYMLMSLDKNSGKIALRDVGETYSGSAVVTEVKNGEWFNIRVEYYYVSDTEMLAVTYINNKLVYVSNNYSHENTKDSKVWPVFKADKYTLPSGSKIGGVEKIMFTMPSNTDVTVYLDNCIIRRTELTPPEVEDEDYTSRADEDLSDIVSGDTGGGSSDSEGDDNTGGTVAPPSQGDIVDNLPNGTWKK